jgi:hypothetical protein
LFGGTSFIKDGTVTNYSQREGMLDGSVRALAEDLEGRIWAATTRGLERLSGTRWLDVTDELKLPGRYIRQVAVDQNGTVWVVCDMSVMFLRRGAHQFIRAHVLVNSLRDSFILGSDHSVALINHADGTVLLSASTDSSTNPSRTVDVPSLFPGSATPGGFIDRDGVIWLYDNDGVRRIRKSHVKSGESVMPEYTGERFTVADGLSGGSSSTRALMEDREGNVWIGTNGGLDRFREARMKSVTSYHGQNIAMAAGEGGTMWAGHSDIGSLSVMYKITDGSTVTATQGPTNITCVYRDPDGEVWAGAENILWRSHSATGTSGSQRPGAGHRSIRNNVGFFRSGRRLSLEQRGMDPV